MRLSEGKPQGEDIVLPELKKKTTEVPSAEAAVHMLTPEEGEVPPQGAEETPKPQRLLSLDAFRGLTILLMLLVNNIALDKWTPDQLNHAPWNGGIRAADLVYPWFLLMVGLSIPFSVAGFKRKELPGWRYELRVLIRAGVLVLLGCIIDSTATQPHRLAFSLGVLQLIGFAYLFGALVYDLSAVRRLFLAGLLLVAYWAAIKFMPVPGIGTGVFEENKHLLAYLNTTFFASFHLEGVLSIIPTTAMVLLGGLLGDVLLAGKRTSKWKGSMLLVLGALLVGLGVVWNLSLPYNKTVWTPSYIVFCAGSGAMALGLFYFLCDVAGWKAWTYPLAVFGANAILAYVAPILIKTMVLDVWKVGSVSARQAIFNFWVVHTDRIAGGWLYTIAYIVICWLGLWLLYRKRVFVRV